MKLAYVLTLACLLAGCSGKEATVANATATPGTKNPPVVEVGHPIQKALGSSLAYTGSLESTHQAAISSEVQGILKEVKVRVGSRVTEGQVLAVVDDSQLDAQVAQAQASQMAAESGVQTAISNEGASRDQVLTAQQNEQTALAQLANVKAAVEKSKSQLGLAQRNYKRIQTVYKQDLISAQALDQAGVQVQSARADLSAAEAQLKASQSQVEQTKAQARVAADQAATARSQVGTARAQADSQRAALASARIRKGYATVTSPVEGVVVSRNLDPGSSVSVSTPIMVVASTALLRVAIKVNEGDLADVREGDEMTVRVDAYPDHVWKGVARHLAGGLDPATRTLRVELEVVDPHHQLLPGMSARVEASSSSRRGLVVPLAAVLSDGDKHFVWVVDKESHAHKAPVNLIRFQDGEAVVTGSVTTKDEVVFSGVDQVSETTPVKAVPVGKK